MRFRILLSAVAILAGASPASAAYSLKTMSPAVVERTEGMEIDVEKRADGKLGFTIRWDTSTASMHGKYAGGSLKILDAAGDLVAESAVRSRTVDRYFEAKLNRDVIEFEFVVSPDYVENSTFGLQDGELSATWYEFPLKSFPPKEAAKSDD